MVLSRLRPQSQRLLSVLAKKVGKVNPNYVTIATPFIALTVPLTVYLSHYWIALLMIMVTGFFDILDGAIARYTGKASPSGAFLDSMMDRFVDITYYATLVLAGYDGLLVAVGLGLTITITYSKARALSLGASIDHKFMERSDRIIIIAILVAVASYLDVSQKRCLMVFYDAALLASSIMAVVKGFSALGK